MYIIYGALCVVAGPRCHSESHGKAVYQSTSNSAKDEMIQLANDQNVLRLGRGATINDGASKIFRLRKYCGPALSAVF